MPRYLIVDASAIVRKVAKRILTSLQDKVIGAESGSAGLGALGTEAPDIVLVDAELPDIDVTDFIRSIRDMRDVAQPIIIVMMTEMNLAQMTKAKRAGADDFMLKPFDRLQLTRSLLEFRKAA